MSAYNNNNETYDNGRLGSNLEGSTGTSSAAYGSTGASDYNSPSTTSSSGPQHKSEMLNKLDPRVDSGDSKAYNSNSSRNDGFSSSNATSDYPSTTGGRADPLLDNENSRFGSSTGQSGLGNSSTGQTGYGYSTGQTYGSSSTGQSGLTGQTGYSSTGQSDFNSSSTNANSAAGFGTAGVVSGPHHTDTANVLDPNVNQSGYGSASTSGGLGSSHTSGGLGGSSGAYESTNAGPHSSNLANKADPRVDSDNDRLRGPDSARDNYGSSNTSSSTGTYGSGTTSGVGYGNKSSDHSDHSDHQDGKKDSTMGKLMEKAGDMLGKDNIAEKGRAKREEAARADNTY